MNRSLKLALIQGRGVGFALDILRSELQSYHGLSYEIGLISDRFTTGLVHSHSLACSLPWSVVCASPF